MAELSGAEPRGTTETVVQAAGGVVWRRRARDAIEVVLVHRPRYDDWSLPKGKLDGDEDHATAAVREVEEETGLRCELDGDLPSTRYRDNRGRTKVVRYWLMHPVAEAVRPSALATGEVDDVVWLPVGEAVATATHERDGELIRAAAAAIEGRA